MPINLCIFCGGDPMEPNHRARCDGRQGGIEEVFPRSPGLPYTGAQPLTVGTSKAAAWQKTGVATERSRVLEFIHAHLGGATDDDIQGGLGMNGDTERPRRIELERMGCVRADGKRLTRKGRWAAVWHYVRPMPVELPASEAQEAMR